MKKFNSGNLPYIAASGQALQFVHAGYILMGWWGALIGAILGLTVNLSIANAASRISDVAKSRRWLSYAGLGALFVLSPAMVAPSAYLAFKIIQVEWVRIGAAIVWALAPDASILLSGAIAGKSLLQSDAIQKSQGAAQSTRTARSRRGSATQCEKCGMQYHSKGAHYRQHHPELVKKKVYAVQVSDQ